MNGMGNDENGKAFFSPETTLTRAQMATLLNRMMEKMDRNYIQGKVSSIDTGNKKMVVNADGKNTTCTIGDMTGIKINGENSKFSRIESQSEVMVTYTFGDVRMIETVPPEENLSVYGIVVQTSDNSGGQADNYKKITRTRTIRRHILSLQTVSILLKEARVLTETLRQATL